MSSSPVPDSALRTRAAQAVAFVEQHKTFINVAGWVAFAAICADYAGFIDLPTLLSVPVWAAAILNMFRWAVWEGWLKERVMAAIQPHPDPEP